MSDPTTIEKKPSSDFEKTDVTTSHDVEGADSEVLGPNELHRGLKNRHAQMISIGGVIGTGLFLGTAASLADGGPLGLLLGYAIVSTACIAMMLSLGELITLLPVAGGQVTLSGRFVDPALAFAMGWNYWYSWVVTLPAELSAAAVLVNYWNSSINNALWITIFGIVVVAINFLGTRAFGEAEFWFASVKVITIVGLIICGLVIDLGGAPDHDRLGFRYWHNPGPLVQYDDIGGSLGRFLGMWSVLIGAGYAYLGTEILGMTAAEIQNPTKNIPKAIRGIWIRILIFYILGVFILGMIVPSDNNLLTTSTGTAASSPWVIAIQLSGIKVLPHIANACFLTAAWSAGSSDLYTSSRAMYGLATIGQAPKIFARTNKYGTPIYAIGLSVALGFLAYMGVTGNSSTVFGYFSNMSTVSGMFNWFGICLTSIRFRQGLKAQGISHKNLPWYSPLQPYAAWWGLGWTFLIIVFADWSVFLKGNWDTASFITNYLPIPIFIILYFGYKFWYKTKIVSLEEMDFVTGITSWKNMD
ncbi:amino acid transporter [Stereum hirsutum FP-91666 SS1]|uniref:amino acid transporter n=1 Tax=Stereum hirsutum (strain FP-91666) TaxID=721885 RepID=UPI000444A56C|nr:amino acid transporter [Stereum hirsutum FP-91666 SS1]EIM81052.1 amino acid transporter [Stereum hirsutum FP-91666 SS1]